MSSALVRSVGWRALGAVVIALVALGASLPSAAAMEVFVSAQTLRQLNVEANAELEAPQAAFWRTPSDADGSGTVSQEEVSILVSTLDQLVMWPSSTDVDAYRLAWARENETGATRITVEGRAKLADFAFTQAQALRWRAAWDGVNGTLARAAISFTGLAGSLQSGASLSILYELVYDFPALDRNEPVHRLTVALPPGLAVKLTVGGALEVVEAQQLTLQTADASKSAVNGTTTGTAPVFLVKERAVSNEALWIVLLAIVVPMGLVAVVSVYALPKMRIPDPELIVEPKYK